VKLSRRVSIAADENKDRRNQRKTKAHTNVTPTKRRAARAILPNTQCSLQPEALKAETEVAILLDC
jgi:hypothetical protein